MIYILLDSIPKWRSLNIFFMIGLSNLNQVNSYIFLSYSSQGYRIKQSKYLVFSYICKESSTKTRNQKESQKINDLQRPDKNHLQSLEIIYFFKGY
jgi:hypothetical protein